MKLEKNGCESNQLFLVFPLRWRYNRPPWLCTFCFPNTEHVILSKEFVFCLFLIYACGCTCRSENFKVLVPKGIITWSALGEQNVQAKENYFSLSKGGQFGAVVAWSLFPNRQWIPGIFILWKCQFIKLESFRSESKDENVDERPTASFPHAMSWTKTHADYDQAKKLVFVRVLQPRSQGLSSPEREGRKLLWVGRRKTLGTRLFVLILGSKALYFLVVRFSYTLIKYT